MQLIHIVAQEVSCRIVRDLSALGDQTGFKLNVGFQRIHQWRIAKAQHSTQALLRDRGANGTGRRTYYCRRHTCERVLAPRPAGPVDRIFQATRDGSVELRRHEQHRIDFANGLLEFSCHRGEVRIIVLTVQGQVPNGDLNQLQLGRCQTHQRLGQQSID
ncbi:hypothetical protein D3C78_689210 [compost metagenome]